MAVPNTVTVTGTVRDINGELYEGAVIEIFLMNQLFNAENLIGNAVQTVYTNSYGRFSVTLVPTDVDLASENYYVFRIIKDTVHTYQKLVRSAPATQLFDDLENYVPGGSKLPMIGGNGLQGSTMYQELPNNLEGIFQAYQVNGDGNTKQFVAPGEIFFVAVNGIIQSETIDYTKQGRETIEFFEAPREGNLVAIFYRI